MSSILTCENITMSYNGLPVVTDVNLDVQNGDYLCIVGENGSGKSTLMKGILGLVKPMTGQFNFHGIKQTEIGYLPQQTMVQKDFPASVYEVVLSGCLNRNGNSLFYTKQDKERANEKIKWLEIEDIKRKSYRALSGGQQQRVLLARALCSATKMLLLDEPVTGLDPVVSAELYSLIDELNKKRDMSGMTIIMISHDINSAVKYGSHILHMSNKPLFYGSTEEYKKTAICRRMMGGDADV